MNDIMRQQSRQLSAEEQARLKGLKQRGQELYDDFDQLGTSREISLAKTKLEEAIMWAVKHLTR